MDLRRENLSQLVLENIQNSIRDGEFKPGDFLPSERELSEKFNVGKSSVREAIKMLHVLGVVESVQGRGTYIRESIGGVQLLRPIMLDMMLQRSNAEELYEFRRMFDMAYITLASQKATEEEKAAVRAKFREYEKLCKINSPDTDRADREFHNSILRAAKNQYIIKIGEMLMELCSHYMSCGNRVPDKNVLKNHKKMMEIFCSGDTSGIEDAVAGSLKVFKHFLDTENKTRQPKTKN